jgi:SsrA-binding protein
MHIAEYKEGGKHYNHLPLRDKKLLMKKKEISKLNEKLSEKGLTIVPIEVIITTTGFIKLIIGLGKGKHTYDKSKAIKLRDLDRDLQKNI